MPITRAKTYAALMDELTEDYGYNIILFYEMGTSEAEKGKYDVLESQNDLTDLFDTRTGTIMCNVRRDTRPRGLTALRAHAAFGDEGSGIIAAALAQNRMLETLDLSGNRVSERTVRALGAALQVNPDTGLRVLQLGFNCFGDEGALALCAALHRNTALTTLDMAGNNLTRVGNRAVQELLHKNKHITTVAQSLRNHPLDGPGTRTRRTKHTH